MYVRTNFLLLLVRVIQILKSTSLEIIFSFIAKEQPQSVGFVQPNNARNRLLRSRNKNKTPEWNACVLEEWNSPGLLFWLPKEVGILLHYDALPFQVGDSHARVVLVHIDLPPPFTFGKGRRTQATRTQCFVATLGSINFTECHP